MTRTWYRREAKTLVYVQNVYAIGGKIREEICGRVEQKVRGAPDEGLEPSTTGLKVLRSTD